MCSNNEEVAIYPVARLSGCAPNLGSPNLHFAFGKGGFCDVRKLRPEESRGAAPGDLFARRMNSIELATESGSRPAACRSIWRPAACRVGGFGRSGPFGIGSCLGGWNEWKTADAPYAHTMRAPMRKFHQLPSEARPEQSMKHPSTGSGMRVFSTVPGAVIFNPWSLSLGKARREVVVSGNHLSVLPAPPEARSSFCEVRF